MKIKRNSHFKDPLNDKALFNEWVAKFEDHNQKKYERIEIETSLGKTQIWKINSDNRDRETLLIFPGYRTSSLFWDFDNGLKSLSSKVNIYLVETNGQPNLSDGNTPDIKSSGYGEWAKDILDKLKIEKTYIAGASFGGLVCMKLCIVAPERIKAAFLLNPGCLQLFSLSAKNIFYNLLPIVSTTEKHIRLFLEKAIFNPPNHIVSEAAEKLCIDYEFLALTRYKDQTQKPYYMRDELKLVKVPTYLLLGDKDILFPFQKSITNAKEKISSLKEIFVFPNVGHGIETYPKAIAKIEELIEKKF